MQSKEIKNQNGQDLLPASTKTKLQKISFDHYREIGFRSINDLITKADKLIKIEHIVNYHENPGKTIAEVFVKSLDQVGRFTGVKNWIDGEGVEYFMQYVLRNHSGLTLGDVQVFCNQVIEGKYGQAFENISVQKLIMWFDQYADRRPLMIRDAKQVLDMKAERIDQSDIDPDGFRKMAAAFKKVYDKHLVREAEKEPSYLSIDEYCDRNEINKRNLLTQLEDQFIIHMTDRIDKKHFTNIASIGDIDNEIYKALLRQYENNFLIQENKKLKGK